MGDSEDYEDDLDDALTEIDQAEDIEEEEELTPIKERTAAQPPEVTGPSTVFQSEAPKGGTFVATLRERFAAFFIDSLILFYLYWVYAVAYGLIFLGSWNAKIPYSGWHGVAFHGSFLLLCFLYYFILEGIFLSTIGKFTCWMSVRRKDGEAASLISTFVRNVIRPIDYIMIFPVAFLMELTKFRQRLGDLVAGSTVVKKFGPVTKHYSITPEIIASATGRTIALTIDMILFLAFAAGYVLTLSPDYSFISRWLLLLSPLVAIVYFVMIEMVTETTAGKWLMGYIICHDNGRCLTISGSLTRTIWLLFDTNPVGLLCLFVSSNRQRPGDLAAGTLVVKGKRTARGAIAIAIALIAAAAALYPGVTNRTNVLSPKFRLNFLPALPFLDDLKLGAPTDEKISIQNFRFAANDPANFRVPPTFSGGETVFVIFEIRGYSKKDRKVWLQEDLAVRYPDGSIGLKQTNIVDYQQVVRGEAPIEFTNNIALPANAEPGEYQVDIVIRDKYQNGQTDELKAFFVRRMLTPTPEAIEEPKDLEEPDEEE